MNRLPDRRRIARDISENYDSEAAAKAALGLAVRTRKRLSNHLRRLRQAYAEIGEQAYLQMSGQEPSPDFDADTAKRLVDGLRAEIAQEQAWLQRCLAGEIDPLQETQPAAAREPAASGVREAGDSDAGARDPDAAADAEDADDGPDDSADPEGDGADGED